MKEYLVTISVTKTYEALITANDDEQIFRLNTDKKKVDSSLMEQISNVPSFGDLIDTEIEIIEVIEGK